MKKRIFVILIMFLGIGKVQAYNLSYYGNELFFYPYHMEEQTQKFYIFTNNHTKEIFFTLKPFQIPSLEEDYHIQNERMEQLDLETQNKINFFIKETQNAEEFKTHMFYYMNTQLLIWNSFYPEMKIEVSEDKDREFYKKELEEKYADLPSWIHDTEIDKTLLLPKEEYNITSNTCKITEKEHEMEISECEEESELIIMEPDHSFQISTCETSEILEGYAPRKWKIKLTQKKEEKNPDEEMNDKNEEQKEETEEKKEPEEDKKAEENPEEKDNKETTLIEKEEENKKDNLSVEKEPIKNETEKLTCPKEETTFQKEESNLSNLKQPNSTWVLDNVPNTLENIYEWLVIILLLCLICFRRK